MLYVFNQIWRTSLTVHWESIDDESPVVEHFVSVMSSTIDHIDIPNVKVIYMHFTRFLVYRNLCFTI